MIMIHRVGDLIFISSAPQRISTQPDRAIFLRQNFPSHKHKGTESTMKMTIVIDSDDREGLNDALKMVRIMQAKYAGTATFHKESFGKIEFIKLLRKYMRESLEHMNNEEDNQVKDVKDLPNLRNAKRFADRIFTGER